MFDLTTDGAPQPDSTPPSFNQLYHLMGSADQDSEAVWLCVAFDIPGEVDQVRLADAFEELARRHETLRSGFTERKGAPTRYTFEPHQVRVLPHAKNIRVTISDEETRNILRELINSSARPYAFPNLFLGAVSRNTTSTVVFAVDHSNADAYSLSVIATELYRKYSDPMTQLPSVGSFLEHCREEAARPLPSPADPRLAEWIKFVVDANGKSPQFPVDLGLTPGTLAEQVTDVRTLLNSEETARFEKASRDVGASVFTGVLTALAEVLRDYGDEPLKLLYPLHTRHHQEWKNAVGWFTTNAPLVVDLPERGESINDIEYWSASAAHTHTEFRRSLPLSSVTLPHVVQALGSSYQPERRDIFMVSYVDYRRIADDRGLNAHHISNVSQVDEVQMWFTRDYSGLALRTRYPKTSTSPGIIAQVLDSVSDLIRQVARSYCGA